MFKVKILCSKMRAAVCVAVALVLLLTLIVVTHTMRVAATQPNPPIWWAHSTEVIRQQQSCPDAKTGTIQVSMAKNEYEGVQLMLSPTEKVSAYTVSAGRFADTNGNEIPESDIEIFHVGYSTVPEGQHWGFKEGNYADWLLPFDKAVEYAQNTIEGGNNQSVYIRFKTKADTHAGQYDGTLLLTMDGVSQEIPVCVTVWDFVVSDQVNVTSAFINYRDPLTFTEDDCTEEMQKAYYDFMLEYRISLQELPNYTNDTDSFLENLRTYSKNPKFSAYALPYRIKLYYDESNPLLNPYESPDLEELQNVIGRIVNMSIEDGYDYLEKAYIYNVLMDEYADSGGVKLELAKKWGVEWPALVKRIVMSFDTAYGTDYLDQVPGLRDSILNIQNLQVSHYVAGVSNLYNNFTPLVDVLASETDRDYYHSQFSVPGKELWWYVCNNPAPPYPSYMTGFENGLLSSRLMSWMMYDYNIKGNLYYSINSLFKGYNGGIVPIDDPYNYGNNEDFYGDGVLVYPGKKWGITGPIGTLRLESIRDGLEEYAYLESLETVYNELSTYYGKEIPFLESARSLLDKLYVNAISTQDKELFENIRETMANNLLMAKDESKLLVESTSFTNKTATVKVLLADGYTVQSGMTPLSIEKAGQGQVLTFVLDRGEQNQTLLFAADNGSRTIEFAQLIDVGAVMLSAFDKSKDLNYLTVGNGGKKAIETFQGSSVAKITLKPYTDVTERRKPTVTVSPNLFKSKVEDASALRVSVYNPNAFDLPVTVTLLTDMFDTMLTDVTLTAGEWTDITISDLSGFDKVQKLNFEFANMIDHTDGYTVYLSNFVYVEK